MTTRAGRRGLARGWGALLLGVPLSLSPGVGSCGGSEDGNTEHEVELIRRISLPEDAQNPVSGPTERSSWAIEARWTFQTRMSWEAYVIWIGSRLPEGFELRAGDERSARFRRQLPGDVHQLDVEATGRPPQLLVAIDFHASAF